MATLPITAEVDPSPTRPVHHELPKLLHLQILRCMAASLVVIDHAILSLNFGGAHTTQYTIPASLLGQMGVSAFFVVSGLIMMRQSADRFAVPGRPRIFAWHRLIRIVPLYWIATILQLLTKLYWNVPTPHALKQMLLSLSFLPDFLSDKPDLQPILNVGWTLNYEMSFYLLFTLCLFLPRKRGVWALILLPALLPIFHKVVASPIDHPIAAIWMFYTNPIIRLFAFGVLIGYIELKLKHLARISLPISPAFLLIAAAIFLLASPATFGSFNYLSLAGDFGALVAVLCTVVTLQNPNWLNRFLVLLGDASYSTYLFHFWANVLIVPILIRIYAHFHQTITSPFLVVAIAAAGANLAGLVIHILLERPITRALRTVIRTSTSS
jgi:exopolysaccharide production protein ExoZ